MHYSVPDGAVRVSGVMYEPLGEVSGEVVVGADDEDVNDEGKDGTGLGAERNVGAEMTNFTDFLVNF